VLSLAVAAERFKPVSRRHPQVAQINGGIEIAKLAPPCFDEVGREALRALAPENGFSRPVLEDP
jgi:hypothetical protein